MNTTFKFYKTDIEGLLEITPFNVDDIRGEFIKDYSMKMFEMEGICYKVMEIFYAANHMGVVRGMHFQREKLQPKLVRCISGSIYDVVVDLRKSSSTFKLWRGFFLTKENKKEILVPAGCAHGYLSLEESIVSYKCAENFYADYDDGILWCDKDINIKWPLERIQGKVIISEKDKVLPSFSEFMNRYGGL